jgi:poly(3-hydroxybutyrate) depolymerase
MRLPAFWISAALLATVASHAQTSVKTPPKGQADLKIVMPVMDCAQLISLRGVPISSVAGVPMRVVSAQVVKEGPAPYCEVKGYVSPQVNFEVHLPTENWTQRFVQVGCGGLCGTLRAVRVGNADGCAPAQNGELALAGTDTGHTGSGGTWAANDPQLRADFGYRAEHVTALAAKALIQRYYGQKQAYAYFVGCSEGGREAAMEAQRYPEDFNGIVSGAPALNFLTQNTFYHAWNAAHNSDDDQHSILTPDKLPILQAAAMEACDALDGLADGIISDPRNCHVDIEKLKCKAGQDPASCLSTAQVNAAKEVYGGARDSKGNRMVISGPMPGSELSWGQFVPANPDMTVAGGATLAASLFQNMAFPKNPPLTSKLSDFHFDQATFHAIEPMREIYDAADPDLSGLQKAGGKLIMWHGWADAAIPPLNTVAYFDSVNTFMGKQKVDQFARLYMFPGGYHCNGGETSIAVDMLSEIIAWVEKGMAPNKIVGKFSKSAGGRGANATRTTVYRTRPVFPYPQIAAYTGTGSVDDEANFKAAMPKTQPEKITWLGSSSTLTGYERWCGWDGMNFSCTKTGPKQ